MKNSFAILFSIFQLLFAEFIFAQDGSLDPTFGLEGIVIEDISGQNDFANAIAIQNDGKILVGGISNGISINDFVILRYNSDGTLDNTFGTSGVTITHVATSYNGINDIYIQNDGKILAAGYASFGTYGDFAMVRYNPNGTLDESFGAEGIVITDFGSESFEAKSIDV